MEYIVAPSIDTRRGVTVANIRKNKFTIHWATLCIEKPYTIIMQITYENIVKMLSFRIDIKCNNDIYNWLKEEEKQLKYKKKHTGYKVFTADDILTKLEEIYFDELQKICSKKWNESFIQ